MRFVYAESVDQLREFADELRKSNRIKGDSEKPSC